MLFIFSIILVGFIAGIVIAQDVVDIGGDIIDPKTGLPKGLPKDTGDLQNVSYLKTEWGKILEKNRFFGPMMIFYGNLSPYTDPVFLILIGMKPAVTWLFVLTFIIWITFIIYMFRISEFFAFYSEKVRYIVAFLLVVLISALGVTKTIAQWTINTIVFFSTTWWIQLIGGLIVIIVLMVLSVFSKNIQDLFKTMAKKREESQEDLDRARLAAAGSIADEMLDN